MLEALNGHITIRSAVPLELISRPGEPGVLLTCGNCRTLVSIEPDLISVG